MAGRIVTRAEKGKRKGKGKGDGKSRKKATSGASPRQDAPAAKVSVGPEPTVPAPRTATPADDIAAPLARAFLWVDSPLAVQRLILGLGALCAFLFLFDLFWHRHAYVPGEGLWGYYAIAGFVSFTVIVLGAKALRTVIRRDEDYYGSTAIDAESYPESGLAQVAAGDGEEAAGLLQVRDARVVGRVDGVSRADGGSRGVDVASGRGGATS